MQLLLDYNDLLLTQLMSNGQAPIYRVEQMKVKDLLKLFQC